MIQESPVLAAIKKGLTSRILGDIEKLAESEADRYAKIWDNFGAVLKEGLCDDFERRDALLSLARFKTTTSTNTWRSLKDYVAALRENQTAIYYLTGDDTARLEASPHLEGFRARGIEVLLLSDPVDSFWTGANASFDGKPFKSVTQGAADLTLIPKTDAKDERAPEVGKAVSDFVAFVKESLGDAVSDVRISERLTDSAVCLVAPEQGPDRQLEKLLMGTGRIKTAAKPVLEINPRHDIIVALSGLGDEDRSFKSDAAHLLFDQARIFDGEQPGDAKVFGERMARVLRAGVAHRKPANAA
jgi:molecular chaperone HtpG